MNKSMTVVVALLAVFLWQSCTQTPEYREPKRYSIEQFMNTTSIFGSSFSPDGSSILFTSDASGIFNAYSVPAAGGTPTQLTFSDTNSTYAVSYFPDDERILLQADQGGNEIWNIYLRELDGSVRNLTPSATGRSTFAGWAFDDQSFFYLSNQRDPRFMDLYEMDIATFTPEMIYQNDAGYMLQAISNNKRYLAFSKPLTTSNTDMYLHDRETGETKHLSPHEGQVTYNPVGFSNDHSKLYFLTDEGSEFSYLRVYNIADGSTADVEKADWDIMYGYHSRNEKYRVVGINADAKTEIRVYDMNTGKQVALPEMPDADITAVNISRDETQMTFYVNGSRSPSNLYIYNFESGAYQKLTESMNPEIDQADLVDGKVIRYKSYDGLEIPAIYYEPHIKPGEKVPALVWVHGGPGGQSRMGYSALIQYLVNHGYAILAVNNRGSSGYGKTFFQMDNQKHGEVDLADCVESKKYLVATGKIEPEKIGIIGGSYGGYMTLAALAFQPDEFAVGVNIFGVSNWLRTLESIPPWWEAFREALYDEMGNPETDRERLTRISPLFHADQIRKPLMVLQGANDPRVLQVESDEIVEAVKKNGVPVEYVLFEDEGHGFSKKENRIKGYKAILDFCNKYLKGETESLEMEKTSG